MRRPREATRSLRAGPCGDSGLDLRRERRPDRPGVEPGTTARGSHDQQAAGTAYSSSFLLSVRSKQEGGISADECALVSVERHSVVKSLLISRKILSIALRKGKSRADVHHTLAFSKLRSLMRFVAGLHT